LSSSPMIVPRWRPLPLASVAVVVVLAVALAAPSAFAGKGVVSVFGSAGSEAGQFAGVGGVAVNRASGAVYVVDQGNNRVEQFDSSGVFVRAWGWGVLDGKEEAQVCTSACQAGVAGSGEGQLSFPSAIAVDQADGSVYVVDQGNNRVQKFSSEGAFISSFGSEGSGAGQLSGPSGVAVDPTDQSVLVANANNNRVDRFDKTGAFVSAFGWGVADGSEEAEVCTSGCQAGVAGGGEGQLSFPTGVAVDSTGRVYVLDAGNGRVERFSAAGSFEEVFAPGSVFAPQQIAVGASDHVFVAQWAEDFSEQHVIELNESGGLEATHGVGSGASNSTGIAAGSGDEHLYLADGFNSRVFILANFTPPTAALEPAANVTEGSAAITGTVNPQGSDTSWQLQISTTSESEGFSPVGEPTDAGAGETDIPISQTLTGLLPDETYWVRLAATRPFQAPAYSNVISFTTVALAPTVTTGQAQDVTPDSVALEGTVNPHNAPTTYYFEYGTTTSYGTSVPASQDADAGAGNVAASAIQRVSVLQAGTIYHFRIVAHNVAGTTTGADQTFTTTTVPAPQACPNARFRTGPSAALPDCRAYEMVSPPDKNGGDVMAYSARTRAASVEDAADPMAVTFASLAGFDGVRGTGVATDYMGIRTAAPGTNGWATHAITPPQRSLSYFGVANSQDPAYEGELSPDLRTGIFRAWSLLSPAPNVDKIENLYLRTNLRDDVAGSYQLLSDATAPVDYSFVPPFVQPLFYAGSSPRFAGASADYGHVLFESRAPLTSDAVGPINFDGWLYEWDHGTLRLAGILPDGSAASASHAGQGAVSGFPALHAISADGRKIFFTVPGGACGAFVAMCGQLYMRVDHSTTVQLNASERAVPDAGAPASYWAASGDGSRVFFTTPAALTDDAPIDGNSKLYMYDTTKPDSDPHNLTYLSKPQESVPSASAPDVIGASTDGRVVYFIANGQLVAGAPEFRNRGIFAWHDDGTPNGHLEFVGALETQNDVVENLPGISLFPQRSRVTPDGMHLLFSSNSGVGLTGYDHGVCPTDTRQCRELYVYSLSTGALQCVSCNPTGAPATADAFLLARSNAGASSTIIRFTRVLTDDGSKVFFSTGEALVPQDVNGKVDVYEYDTASGTVHLISTGRSPSDSYLMDISPSGRDVFFTTRQQLVGWDTDDNTDLYDARIDGGVPDPQPAAPVCSGDGCQGQAGPGLQSVLPSSGSVSGADQVTNPPKPKAHKRKVLRCRRGFVRKRVHHKLRCVRKHRPKGHKAAKARRSTHDRRPR
jgi:DNA-binding beta-propeller fold protein YncE